MRQAAECLLHLPVNTSLSSHTPSVLPLLWYWSAELCTPVSAPIGLSKQQSNRQPRYFSWLPAHSWPCWCDVAPPDHVPVPLQ